MNFVAIDLETTWLNKNNDSIIEIAILKYENFLLVDELCSLINPGFSIPEEISYITWIYDKDVEDSPTFVSLKQKIKDFIWDSIIVGHNVSFDVGFLVSYWIDLTYNNIVDTFELSQILLYKEKSLSLTSLCASLWWAFLNAHRARNDTVATVWLLEKLLEVLTNLSLHKKQILYFIYFLDSRKNSFSIILEKYLSEELHNVWIEEIEDLIISKIPKYKKKEIIKNEEIFLNLSDILKSNTKNGWNIEERWEQKKMIEIIKKSFDEKKLSLIEAPTGIWKTFAYLIPALIHSLKTWSQVIISTNTKWLQDQIIYKDIPKLKEILKEFDENLDFLYSKVKWRKNYLSLLKFFEFINNKEKWSEEIIFIWKVLFWLTETKTWELDELNYYSKEFSFLKEIDSGDKRVLWSTNLFKQNEFLYKARNNAKTSNIVIINHSLLFQDLENQSPILPKINNLIIDEAHNLESSVTQSLKKHCSYAMFDTNLAILESILKQKFSKDRLHNSDSKKPTEKFFDIKEWILMHVWIIFDFFDTYIENKKSSSKDFDSKEYLIWNDMFSSNQMTNILNITGSLETKIHLLLDDLYNVWDEIFEKIEWYLKDLEEYLSIIKIILKEEKDSKYIKVVCKDDKNWCWIYHTLLNVWDYLKQNLWSTLDCGILTSATFKIGESFSFIENTLWLENFKTYELMSDFDYSKQALVFIPSDIWDIRSAQERKNVNEFIKNIICTIGWRTLCLFTSFSTIKEAFLHVFPDLKKAWINLLV